MTEEVLALIVKLKDEASAQAEKMKGSLGGLNDVMKNVGMVAGGVALAGIAALGAGIAGGVEDARNSQVLYAATQKTIESMGNAAGVSADHVVDMASALSDAAGKSLFGDDQIQQSTNLLLTFGEIKGATLDAATALTVDLAQALGGAPKDQAMMLGKALNDPIHGMTALGKAGLTFTEQQKEQVKAMQEAGDMAGAQALIIAELNKQVGGQAEAAAHAAGGMVQFQAGLGETFETIGSKLLPLLDKLGAWLTSPEVQAAITTFAENLANGIEIAADFLITKLIPAVIDLYNWLAPRLGPILSEIGRMLFEDLPRGINRAELAWEGFKLALASFKEAYIDPIIRGWELVAGAADNAKKSFDSLVQGVQSAVIPSWLQGHSPPPLADWLSYIGDAADSASQAFPGLNTGINSANPALTPITGGAGGGAGGTSIVVQSLSMTFTQPVQNGRELFQQFRDELTRVANANVTSGVV